MTDKQIIIDSVDVSGCDFYDKNKKYCLTLKMNPTGFKNPSCFSGDFQKCIQDSKVCPYTFCDNNPNCYYKQLKRKEQEYERLKRDYFKQNEWLQEQKKELNQLKAENDTYKKMLEDEDVQLALNEVRTGERHLWYNKAQKLSQALTEIKEILLFNKKELEECLYNDIDGQIIQKCEVLDEN